MIPQIFPSRKFAEQWISLRYDWDNITTEQFVNEYGDMHPNGDFIVELDLSPLDLEA